MQICPIEPLESRIAPATVLTSAVFTSENTVISGTYDGGVDGTIELERLAELHQRGQLSDDEFQRGAGGEKGRHQIGQTDLSLGIQRAAADTEREILPGENIAHGL